MLIDFSSNLSLTFVIQNTNTKSTKNGSYRQVRVWLENGQDVDKADSYGNTGLLLAAEKGLVEVCSASSDLLSTQIIFPDVQTAVIPRG